MTRVTLAKTRAWRRGPWLLAYHPTVTPFFLPALDLWPGQGWSLVWLWFEIARVKA